MWLSAERNTLRSACWLCGVTFLAFEVTFSFEHLCMLKTSSRCNPSCSRNRCRWGSTNHTCGRAEPSRAEDSMARHVLSKDVLGQAGPVICSTQQVPVGNLTPGNARRLPGLLLPEGNGTSLEKQITKSSHSHSHKPHKICPFSPPSFFWVLS